MEVKVEQWVRLDNGYILQRVYIEFREKVLLRWKRNDNEDLNRYEDNNDYLPKIIKVADTPQELIQVGDCYISNNDKRIRHLYDDETFKQFKKLYIKKTLKASFLNNITKILTPNSNGDYIKQWEAKT